MTSPVLDVQDENAHGSAAFQSDGRRTVKALFKDFSGLFAYFPGGDPCLVFHALFVPDHLIRGVIAIAVDGALRPAVAFGAS